MPTTASGFGRTRSVGGRGVHHPPIDRDDVPLGRATFGIGRTEGLLAAPLRGRLRGRARLCLGTFLAVFFALAGAARRSRGIGGLGGPKRAAGGRAARQKEI